MTDRINLAELRDIQARAQHQLDDGEHFVLHVSEIPALLALVDAIEAVHAFCRDFERQAAEQTGAPWDGPDVGPLFAGRARFDFGGDA